MMFYKVTSILRQHRENKASIRFSASVFFCSKYQYQKEGCVETLFENLLTDCVLLRENVSVCTPVPDACAIAKVSSNQSLQGRQSRATYLLSAGTPATSWHGRQLPWQPRTPPTNQQPPGLFSFSSMSHHVNPGHCGGVRTKAGKDK